VRRRTSQRHGMSTRRALLASVGVAATVLASGCAAGQIAQTAEEQPGVPGAQATLGEIQLHNVTVAYPNSGSYTPGSTGRLNFVVVNDGTQADHLIGVSAGAAKTVRISGPDGNKIQVGPQSSVNVYGDGPKVQLTDMVRQLRSSQQTTVTFRFARAGEVAISVPVAPAATVLPTTHLVPKG
jgi:copper(I)-binding protein